MKQDDFILQDNSSITIDRFQEIFDRLMKRTWEYNGNFYNLHKLGWTWGYSRKKQALGTATYTRMKGIGKIEISKPLLSVNLNSNPRKFEDTIRHEIAHAIDYTLRDESDHGIHWQKIAIHLGAQPETGKKTIVSVPKKWIGQCKGNHYHWKHSLTKSAKTLACGKCCRENNNGAYSEDYLIQWEKQF